MNNQVFVALNAVKLFLFSFIISLPLVANGQELPPVINFPPEVYQAENQNWAISQASNKNIYVANNLGLLEFNGSKWNLYNSPNNTVLRSVKVIDNKVYTGCYMEFGYWIANEYNRLEYFSLSNTIKETILEDEQFWNIIGFDSWILFQSLHRIYIYDTNTEKFNIISSVTNLPKVFKVDETIYFQKMNQGLFKLENGLPVLVDDNDLLKDNIIVDISRTDKGELIQTQEAGIFVLYQNELQKWEHNFEGILDNASVFTSRKLKNGDIALGTISNGMFVLGTSGEVKLHIDQVKGINNNTVLSLFEDEDQNIWLGLDNGISVINMNSPIKVFSDHAGSIGSVYDSEVYDGALYLGTNQGLFYKPINDQNGNFTFVEGTNGQVWSLNTIDNTLFCGHNSGTFVINNKKATLISDEMGAWGFQKIPEKPDLILQGNYEGLHILKKENNTWNYRNKLEGFDISSRYFELLDNSRIFVSHEYKGVFELLVDDDFRTIELSKITSSAPKSFKSSIKKYNNDLLYFSENGILRYNADQGVFESDSIFTKAILDSEEYYSGKLILEENTNTLWSFTKNFISYISPGKLNTIPRANKIAIPASFRKNNIGYENLRHIENRTFLIGTSKGYIVLDLDKVSSSTFGVVINSVRKNKINGILTPLSMIKTETLRNDENNVSFDFNVPVFNKFQEVNYQYVLEGLHSEWSGWTQESEAQFKNLNYGQYTFKVRAKVGDQLTNIATYEFEIDRPFYLSNVMITVYTLLLISVFIAIHLIYQSYYTKQKQQILEKKQRELSYFQLENDKVIMKLKNDKLRSEVEGKSRELAASTMNIVKKNELLNTIKKELSDVKSINEINSVIKTINKNLSNNSDWEVFQEAFNNTDRDFLQKVKLLHENLTPNDLKLCVYLRLNMSSKEIAPLLNISPRSVEIKRYRLRKKMELSHEKSLVEYILEI